MKKILALILALCMMVVVVTACGPSSDNNNRAPAGGGNSAPAGGGDNSAPASGGDLSKDIVGKWVSKIDFSKFIVEEIQKDFPGFNTKFELSMTMEFKADGTAIISFDENEFFDALGRLIDEIIPLALQMAAEEAGMSVDELLSLFEQELGVSFEDFMIDALAEEFTVELIEEMLVGLIDAGYYKIEDDKLFFSNIAGAYYDDDYSVITISGNNLTLVSTTDTVFNEMFTLPLVFSRAK